MFTNIPKPLPDTDSPKRGATSWRTYPGLRWRTGHRHRHGTGQLMQEVTALMLGSLWYSIRMSNVVCCPVHKSRMWNRFYDWSYAFRHPAGFCFWRSCHESVLIVGSPVRLEPLWLPGCPSSIQAELSCFAALRRKHRIQLNERG